MTTTTTTTTRLRRIDDPSGPRFVPASARRFFGPPLTDAETYLGPVWAVTETTWRAVSGADLDPEGDATPEELDAALAAHPGDTTEPVVTYWTSREAAEAHAAAQLDAVLGEEPDRAAAEACTRRSSSSLEWMVGDAPLWRVTAEVSEVRA